MKVDNNRKHAIAFADRNVYLPKSSSLTSQITVENQPDSQRPQYILAGPHPASIEEAEEFEEENNFDCSRAEEVSTSFFL
ncbi:unnamed protein product [Protopolystoma xenopodis]|uniref:Uncharacterized protein n=1 Tax=Protopolystoma xenopodis TaxID=117903 RepID=A0A448X8T0_9PLAT|nr:unnamed protein product [Protopolystoma xenopodis]